MRSVGKFRPKSKISISNKFCVADYMSVGLGGVQFYLKSEALHQEHTLRGSSFEKKLGRKIELHFNDTFNSYSKELKNNIINGMVLGGFLEGYK